MKKTAMQDLREDLILTQTSVKEALLEIENKEARKVCQVVVKLTLSNIIKRIDEELLELEKHQIIDSCNQTEFEDIDGFGIHDTITKGEQYYNNKFINK